MSRSSKEKKEKKISKNITSHVVVCICPTALALTRKGGLWWGKCALVSQGTLLSSIKLVRSEIICSSSPCMRFCMDIMLHINLFISLFFQFMRKEIQSRRIWEELEVVFSCNTWSSCYSTAFLNFLSYMYS